MAPLDVTLIRPRPKWQLIDLNELWQYREVLYYLTWRDVKIRYKQTVLGAAWAVLQPLCMMAIIMLVLGIRGGVQTTPGMPQPLFFFSGLLLWQFFSTAVGTAGMSVVQSQALITKVYFPRLSIPFASVGAAGVDFCIAFGMLVLLMLWYGTVPGWSCLLMPVLLVFTAMAALGVGATLAALNVTYRDFRHTLPFMLQLWMLATPTIFMDLSDDEKAPSPVAAASDTQAKAASRDMAEAEPSTADSRRSTFKTIAQWINVINPVAGLVAAFRCAVLGYPIPGTLLVCSTVWSIALFLIGCLYFRKAESSFADVI